jgi:hypothetical protein
VVDLAMYDYFLTKPFSQIVVHVFFYCNRSTIIKKTFVYLSKATFADDSAIVVSDPFDLIFGEVIYIVIVDGSPLRLFTAFDQVSKLVFGMFH